MTRTWIEGVVNADGSQGYALNHHVGCDRRCPYCWAKLCLQRSQCPKCRAFVSHWHPERLEAFKKLKGANTVAVGWMGDIWANTVSMGQFWVDMMHPLFVASHMGRNTLLFLTREPKGYLTALSCYNFGPEAWLGVTVTCQADVDRIGPDFAQIQHPNKFVSYEPILGEITDWSKLGPFGWLYTGMLTKGKCNLSNEEAACFAMDVIAHAHKIGAKVWAKNSLGEDWVKQTPWLRG